MGVELYPLVSADVRSSAEFNEVRLLAEELHRLVNTDDCQRAFSAANQLGMHSQKAQQVVASQAETLGFVSERKGLFAAYKTRGLRPDMYRSLGSTGVLLEVERGKTLKNNMDLLDFWKCHICTHADYLFLFVPQSIKRSNEVERPFQHVVKRLGAFFEPGNLTNVKAAFVFGY